MLGIRSPRLAEPYAGRTRSADREDASAGTGRGRTPGVVIPSPRAAAANRRTAPQPTASQVSWMSSEPARYASGWVTTRVNATVLILLRATDSVEDAA